MGFLSSVASGFGRAVLGRAFSRGDARRGHQLDNRFSLEKEQTLYDRAMARGMTPQEYYGSSAPGTTGPSGGAQVLGNATQQSVGEAAKMAFDATQRDADRKVTMRGQDAQVEAAKYSADQSRQATQDTVVGSVSVQQLRNMMEDRKLTILERDFEEIRLRAAAEQLELTKQEVKIATNKAATTTPKWEREMKLYSMGFDNVLQTMQLDRAGIEDLRDISKLSDSEYAALLQTIIGNSSTIARELKGVVRSVKDLYQWLKNLPKEDTLNIQEWMSGPTLGSTSAK